MSNSIVIGPFGGKLFIVVTASENCYNSGMAAVTPADIFSRIIDPANPTLTPEAAQALLRFEFADADQARVAELARKSNEGSLAPDEREELESYVLVGDIFSLMKSKARLSLRKRTPAA